MADELRRMLHHTYQGAHTPVIHVMGRARHTDSSLYLPCGIPDGSRHATNAVLILLQVKGDTLLA